jgi:hypothetical protein
VVVAFTVTLLCAKCFRTGVAHINLLLHDAASTRLHYEYNVKMNRPCLNSRGSDRPGKSGSVSGGSERLDSRERAKGGGTIGAKPHRV